jgi:hypothetical protein
LEVLVGEGGRLVVAGILKEEFGKIQTAFMGGGFWLERSRVEGEWRSGSFLGGLQIANCRGARRRAQSIHR